MWRETTNQLEKLVKPLGGNGSEDNKLVKTWWPWGAGMFATSLGPHDACSLDSGGCFKTSGGV